VGRQEELAVLESHLDTPTTQLITITGLGGSGKTRLALHTADGRRGEYLNGIIFISLLGVENAAYLPTSLATQLDVPLQSNAPTLPQLLNHLSQQELLLILDNFDHLAAEGASIVQQLLTAAPDVTLLVSSREPLGIAGEQIVPLAGLPFVGESAPAVHLFHLCAQRGKGDLGRTEGDLAAVQQICHAVEGLPLAIELAAALFPQQPLQRIAADIQHTLANLTTRWRDMPARHRSLAATFDYSWNLLTPAEQKALAGLAIFRQPFEAATASAIAHATPNLLHQLTRKSLLKQRDEGYLMLAMVRQFAQAKLEEMGRWEEVAEAHGRYYLQLLAAQEPLLNGAELSVALLTIAPKLEEFRAAWQWGMQQEMWLLIEGAIESVALFFEAKGWTFDGLTWFSETVAALPATAPGMLHGRLLSWLGYCQERTGQIAPAQATLTQSLALLHAHPRWQAFAYKHLGTVAYAQGLHEQAAEHFQAAVALYEEVAFAPGLSSALTHLAHLQLDIGAIGQSEAFAQRGLALAQERGNPRDAAIALAVLGQLAERGGDYGRAQAIYRDNLALCEQLGDVAGLAYGHHRLGNLVRQLGQLAEAKSHYEAGLGQAERLHDPWWRALFAVRLGNLAEETMGYGEAQRLYHEALHLCEQMGDRRGIAITNLHLGTTAAALGHESAAFAHLITSVETASAIQFMPIALEALLRLAQREQNQWPPALLARVVAFVQHHPATTAAWQPALAALAEGISQPVWQTAVAANDPEKITDIVAALRP
jgi:predicted ATPase